MENIYPINVYLNFNYINNNKYKDPYSENDNIILNIIEKVTLIMVQF